MVSILYATFMPGCPSPRRTFTVIGLETGPRLERTLMDLIFIAAGVGLFAVFAGYAALLRRI
jgi:hypothetical protein